MSCCEVLYRNVGTEKHGSYFCTECGSTWDATLIIQGRADETAIERLDREHNARHTDKEADSNEQSKPQ